MYNDDVIQLLDYNVIYHSWSNMNIRFHFSDITTMTSYNYQTMSKAVEGKDGGGGSKLLQTSELSFYSFVFIWEILKKYLKSLLLVFCLTWCEKRSGAHLIIWFQNRFILVTLRPKREKWWGRGRQLLKISELFLFIHFMRKMLKKQ